MSHNLTFESTCDNEVALKRALIRSGVPENLIEVHETPVRLNTYHEEERKYAHVVVRRKVFSKMYNSDIGWERNSEGMFVGHIDEHNYGDAPVYNAEWLTRLYTYYNIEVNKMSYEKRNIPYEEKIGADGRVEIRAYPDRVKKTAAQQVKARAKTSRIVTHSR